MNPKWEKLYNDLQADIARCLELEHPEKENVESCFWIAKNYWDQLQVIIKGKGFSGKEDEIQFYRQVKPAFASYIEYFSLLAESLMFEPPWVPFPTDFAGNASEAEWKRAWQSSLTDYWKHEEKRSERFYSKNQVFIDYCESGSNENDEQFFLSRSNEGRDLGQRRSHNRDSELFTVHEEILTTWMGYKMYKEYIKKKVNEPAHS